MKGKNVITRWSILIGLFFLLLSPLPGSAKIILFDDFNSENGGVGYSPNYTGFINWDVTQGAVDLIGNGYWDLYPGNGLFVDLDDSGQLTSKTLFSLTPGKTYTLQYDLGGNRRIDVSNSVNVTLGPFSETHILAPYDPLTTFIDTFTVEKKVSDYLVFNFERVNSDIINWSGAILDNVQLSWEGGAGHAPVPSTIFLLGSGILGMAGWRRFRKG